MANGKAEISTIDLSSISVNLNGYLNSIQPYTGFIQCNSPYIGGLLNNVYRKTDSTESNEFYHNGNKYKLDGLNLYRNDELINTFSGKRIKKERLENNRLIIPWNSGYIYINKKFINFPIPGGVSKILQIPKGYTVNLLHETTKDEYFITIAPTISTVKDFKEKSIVWEVTKTGASSKWSITASFPSSWLSQFTNIFGFNILNEENYTDKDKYPFSDDEAKVIYTPMEVIVIGKGSYNSVIPYEFRGQVSANKIGISHNDYWEGGVCTPHVNNQKFRALYNNFTLSGISTTTDSLITTDVVSIIYGSPDGKEIVYEDNNGDWWKLSYEEGSTSIDYYYDDDFIYFDSTFDYYNTYDFQNEKMICRSDDWNNRAIPTKPSDEELSATPGTIVSAVNSQVQTDKKNRYCSIQYAPVSFTPPTDKSTLKFYDPSGLNYSRIGSYDVFLAESTGDSPSYYTTIKSSSEEKDIYKEGILYTVNSANNILYNISLDMTVSPTYLPILLGKQGDSSFVLATNGHSYPILAYYMYTESEMNNLFMIQGSYYGINDRYIASMEYADSIISTNSVVCNKLDLEFIGAFPQFALFWSKMDKSFYQFTGDRLLGKVKDSYRIKEIRGTYCDPARLTMLVSTDIGTIVIYQNQTFLLDDLEFQNVDKIYYDTNSYIIGNNRLSFSNQDGFEPLPIKIQTEYYGVGNGVKSVNDCVYIRLAKQAEINNATLKIESFVLNEKATSSGEKVFNITDSMIDTESNSIYIRYQPKIQSGSGFSVKMESTLPIVSIFIGHTPEAMLNSSKNM